MNRAQLEKELRIAKELLQDALNLMDNVHCYDSKEYHAISDFLGYNDEEEEEEEAE